MSTPDQTEPSAEVVATEGVLGGKPRIKGHRISVLDIAELLDTGYSIAETAEQLEITEEEVRAATRYYRRHRSEMAEYAERRREVYEQLRDLSRDPTP